MTDTLATETAGRVVVALAAEGVDFATGVPCSLLKGLFSELEKNQRSSGPLITYLPAPREDSAVGIAVGAHLAGATPVVLMQNSGLGYSLNVLTSLTMIYDIHPLIIMSWRGYNQNDAVEHDIIGRQVTNLLDVLGIGHMVLDPTEPELAIQKGVRAVNNGSPFVVLVTEEI